MAAHGSSSTNTERHLVDELEAGFKACLSALVAQETVHVHDQIEQKTSVEQSVQRFLELAKETENFFLQRQLFMATSKPDNIVKEEIDDLKAELARKNALLQKQQTKVNKWLNELQSMEGGGQSQPQPQHAQQLTPQQQQQQQQQQLHMAQLQQQQQHQQQQLANRTMSMNMGMPGSIPQPQGGMQQGGMGMGGMDVQGQGLGGSMGGGGTQAVLNQPLTGPLAHLEQAMSSIGGTGFDRR